MGIEIRNVGRVENADIICEGITVVAGENGSGKSTVSKSLYAILSSFYGLRGMALNQRRRSITRVLVDWQKQIEEIEYLSVSERLEMRKAIRPFMLKKLEQEEFCEKLTYVLKLFEISEYDEEELEMLYKEYAQIQKKGIEYYEKYVIQSLWEDVFCGQVNTLGQKTTSVVNYDEDALCLSVKIEDLQLVDYHKKSTSFKGAKPIYIASADMIDSLGTYQGAIRVSNAVNVSRAKKELSSLLLEEVSPQELVAEDKEKIRFQKEVLEDILGEIIHGDVQVKEEHLSYVDDWCDMEVQIPNIASGMKIFVIIKKLLENGIFLQDVMLIFDEPETNLHPEWQLKLAELLVLLYGRLGIRIYINSHSPYFVRAVEYYANEQQILEKCHFYYMNQTRESGMYQSVDVTDELGIIYDRLAEPLNQLM